MHVVEKEFLPLKIPQKRIAIDGAADVQAYKVYSSDLDFEIVEAETVTEAIDKSGIEKPFRVAKVSSASLNILEKGELLAMEEPAAEGEEEASEADSDQ